MKPFKLRFLCADETTYDGDVVSIQAPLVDGQIGILADHANMCGILTIGDLKINTGTEIIDYAVAEGLVQITDGNVMILCFSAEKPEEIDAKRAERAAERARIKLQKKISEVEYRQAQANLARALNRLKVKNRG